MTENQALYLVFALLYLWECLDLGDASKFRFKDFGWGKARLDGGWIFDQGRYRGAWLAWPLPPLGRLYRSGIWAPCAPSALNGEESARLLQALDHQGRLLTMAANIHFVYTFLFWPALVIRYGLIAFNIPLVLIALGLNGLCALLYFRLHKRLFPGDSGERKLLALQALALPTVAIRLRDRLGRASLGGLHPLAASKLLSSAADFRRLARRAWREALHPLIGDVRPGPRWTQTLEAWLREQGLEIRDLAKAPLAMSSSSRSYCPRCLTESTRETGDCPDCLGIPLRSFRMES